jgi:soluble lytic murein transglycosylase-like protein
MQWVLLAHCAEHKIWKEWVFPWSSDIMNPPPFRFLLVLSITFSSFAGLSGALHAEDSKSSLYRLSPELVAERHYSLAPYRWSGTRPADSRPYAQQIAVAAEIVGLDPELVHAVIAVESGYQASAVSPKGAVGLMQLMPATARSNGTEHPDDVMDNLRAGTRHLKALLVRFDHRLDLALAAYNAGEGAVRRYGNSVPPYPETRHYVPAVVARYRANSQAATGTTYRNTPSESYLSGSRRASTTPSVRQ